MGEQSEDKEISQNSNLEINQKCVCVLDDDFFLKIWRFLSVLPLACYFCQNLIETPTEEVISTSFSFLVV